MTWRLDFWMFQRALFSINSFPFANTDISEKINKKKKKKDFHSLISAIIESQKIFFLFYKNIQKKTCLEKNKFECILKKKKLSSLKKLLRNFTRTIHKYFSSVIYLFSFFDSNFFHTRKTCNLWMDRKEATFLEIFSFYYYYK